MPSAVDTVTFQNKKPKSSLTGSATQAESTNNSNLDGTYSGFNQSIPITGQGIPDTSSTVFNSLSINTPNNSLVVISASAAAVRLSQGSRTITVQILDGTTLLKSGSFTASTHGMASLLFVGTPLPGNRTYNVRVVISATSNAWIVFSCSIHVSHVQLTDTHAASSKTTNIING